jgi:hypothetical protein
MEMEGEEDVRAYREEMVKVDGGRWKGKKRILTRSKRK